MNVIKFKVFLFLVIMCNFTIGEKKTIPAQSSNVKKLNDCRRCKILTDSFNHWMEKTSRGKFEGGDAAWEEAKLRSYARSEIRLVEVQEGLCSEVKKHQDVCYSIAEEAEQPLEKWWFHEDPSSVDLHTWLCIETLQHCCPSSHFGESCLPCPLGKNNKICSGNGKCDGEGTRNGNGLCVCKKGFIGSLCEDCAHNFYHSSVNTCKPCDKACKGCTGDGPSSCVSCESGWQLEGDICVDLNECLNDVCHKNQYCENNEGSYSCTLCDKSCNSCVGDGPSNCTTCHNQQLLWGGYCVDEKHLKELYVSIFKRIALICGLLIICYFVFKKSKLLASFAILIIAIYIYLLEKSSSVSIFDAFVYKKYLF